MAQDTNMRRLGAREHYATHGTNASIVTRSAYRFMASLGAGHVTKTTTLAFRHGRTEDGEAVQGEVTIDSVYASGRKRQL